MKKMLLVVMLVVGLMVSPALACQDCGDQFTGAMGSIHVGSDAAGGGFDFDFGWTATGISVANGFAEAGGSGSVYNGTVGASVGTIAGGLTDTEAFNGISVSPNSITFYDGVGSVGDAIVGASASVNVFGFGYVGAGFYGQAYQASVNETSLPGTDAVVTQNSNGVIWGNVGALFWGSAIAEGQIHMEGNSQAVSYNTYTINGPAMTYETGSIISANTNIATYGFNADRGIAWSQVCGNYEANGMGYTTSEVNGGTATAYGAYMGAGALNTNYQGSLNGGSYAAVTTVDGMEGQIVSTGSSMQVTSFVDGNKY